MGRILTRTLPLVLSRAAGSPEFDPTGGGVSLAIPDTAEADRFAWLDPINGPSGVTPVLGNGAGVSAPVLDLGSPEQYEFPTQFEYFDYNLDFDPLFASEEGFSFVVAYRRDNTSHTLRAIHKSGTTSQKTFDVRLTTTPNVQVYVDLVGGGQEVMTATGGAVGNRILGISYDRAQAFGSRLSIYNLGVAATSPSLSTVGSDGEVNIGTADFRVGMVAWGDRCMHGLRAFGAYTRPLTAGEHLEIATSIINNGWTN